MTATNKTDKLDSRMILQLKASEVYLTSSGAFQMIGEHPMHKPGQVEWKGQYLGFG